MGDLNLSKSMQVYKDSNVIHYLEPMFDCDEYSKFKIHELKRMPSYTQISFELVYSLG